MDLQRLFARRANERLGLLALLICLAPAAALGQNAPAAQAPAPEPAMRRMSSFGAKLSETDANALLREMHQMAQQALATSRSAEQAASVADVKAAADRVYQMVWGMPSAAGGAAGAIRAPGWKENWQVTGAEFHADFQRRLGTASPTVTDPRQLGMMGRGRAVRGRLEEQTRGSSLAFLTQQGAQEEALVAINNVIGWTYVATGLKGREVQPRISLTHIWDAPPAFWNSTADTGWMGEAEAQAINILKTDYRNDVAEARRHVAALSQILTKVIDGVDADRSGRVEAKPMEGGIAAAVAAASRVTLTAEGAR